MNIQVKMIDYKTILKESELNCIHQDLIEHEFDVYYEIIFHCYNEFYLEKYK